MTKRKGYYEAYLEREAHHTELYLEELRRKDMRDRCEKYISKPCSKMTDREAMAFAAMLTEGAKETIPMTEEEALMYAGAIYSSIRYFNDRDKEHQAYMRYLEECQKQKDFEAIQRRNTKDRGRRLDVFVY